MCALEGGQPDCVPFCEGHIAANIAREIAGSDRNLEEWEISRLVGRDVVVPIIFPPYFADSVTLDDDDDQAYITHGWLKTRNDLDKMVFPDPNDPALYADAKKVLENKGDFACAAAIKQGVASTLVSMGMDNFAYAMADDPWLIHEILRRYVDWQIVVTENLIEMGFDYLWCYDDVAYKSGPLCSPRAFRKFLLPAFQRHAEAITIPWVFHSDGNIMPVIEDILSLGPSAIHPLEPGPMDLAAVKEEFGKRVCLIGNVSVDRLSQGTPEEIDEIVKNCIKVAGPGGGYMISSSNSIPRYARAENVKAMAKAIDKYRHYPVNL
jgi:uroporphyrinogen decarboxylase